MSEYDVPCPMPNCGVPLHIVWSGSYSLLPDDLLAGKAIEPGDAHSSTWQVECEEGHVILQPDSLGCPCDDQEGPDCRCDQDGFDHTDDYRTFRPHDVGRLTGLISLIGEPS
jgi:hypothetical protein